ncbi:MAG: 50S ribosome-binding GTPase [Anaerolineae bacterium]|nr:50S ribosome-binding GTPase [Anaerolineae bacterium]
MQDVEKPPDMPPSPITQDGTDQNPPNFQEVLSKLLSDVSDDSRILLQTVYEALPTDKKSIIAANLEALVQDVNPTVFFKIVRLALRQYEGVFDQERRQISIVGPVNVGKSSLFNALIMPKETQAEVSPVPGTTRLLQAADAGLCTVIDTPGGDEAAGEERKALALSAARAADSLIVVFDAASGVTQGTRELFEELRQLKKPMVLVLNKIDLVDKYQDQVLDKAARDLGVSKNDLILASATKGTNLEQIVFALIRLNPGLLSLVSELVPQYRRQIAARYIAGAAVSAFAVGSTPLPVADFFPLMAIQVGLVLQLGRVFGKQVSWDTAKEILLTLGGGVGLREGFRQLIKIVPVPIANWLGSGLYAAIATAALGLTAREYWAHGGIGQDWKQTADRFRKQLWNRIRSPGFLKRLRNREQAAEILEETIETQAALEEQTTPQERVE